MFSDFLRSLGQQTGEEKDSDGEEDKGEKKPKPEEELAKKLEKIAIQTKTGFFPKFIRGQIMRMAPVQLDRTLFPTVIIGTVSKIFDSEQFDQDVEAYRKHFNYDTIEHHHIIKMMPIPSDLDIVNSEDATETLYEVIKIINTEDKIDTLRIVQIGCSHPKFIFEAIETLVKEVNFIGPKKVQFVTTGDSSDSDKLNFWRSQCVKGLISQVDFYNTQLYHPFGYFKLND